MASKTKPNVRTVLACIATILESPRDRLGRLESWHGERVKDEALRLARETIREFAVRHCVTSSRDTLEQCAKVARVALGE